MATAYTGTSAELIAAAGDAGVELWVEGNRLRFRGPSSALSDALRRDLREHRAEVMRLLRERAAEQVETGPVAANQRGLWLLQQLAPDSAAYNIGFALRLLGSIDEESLAEALQILVDRHDALRTTYPGADGNAERAVAGYRPFRLRTQDLEGALPAAIRSEVETDYRQPFDLAADMLLRATLFREAPDSRILLLVAHHIAVDGTSLVILIEELLDVYNALASNEPVPAAANGASFAEFVAWQNAAVSVADAERDYWSGVLTPYPPALDLPSDRSRADLSPMRGATLRRVLDAQLTGRIREQARAYGVTDYVMLLSLWFAFLHRISGQVDITVGTPVQGRPSDRFSRTVGDLINLLPIRIRAIESVSFRELVATVGETVLSGMAMQEYPLPLMVEDSSQVNQRGAAPFQSYFILQDFTRFSSLDRLMRADEGEVFEFGGLQLGIYPLDTQEGQFDLSLDMWMSGDEIAAAWRFDSDLFDAATIAGWADSFEQLARGILDSPEAPVASIPAVDDAALPGLEQEPSAVADADIDDTVDALILRNAMSRPENDAICFNDQVLSYRDLDERSARLAAYLRQAGLKREDLVGICLHRGADMVVAMLGILRAGGSFLPLDPAFPPDRLTYMVADSATRFLVTESTLQQALFAGMSGAAVCLDTDADALAAMPADLPPAGTGGSDRAYVIYTSGSTGRPKGVEIEHRAWVNFLLSMAETPGMSPADVLFAVTTLSFDISLLELALPLVVGGTVVVADSACVADGEQLRRALEDSGATLMQATPTSWRLLIEAGWQGDPAFRVLCGGEPFPADLAEALQSRAGAVWNMYGPTETTIWSTCALLQPGDPVHIGNPIANTRTYILNDELQAQPAGVPGELWLAGAGVARGYLGQPELTGERFVPDPFVEHGRMYRTGDRACWTSGGRLLHLGRIDNQVKVRGFRIELGEIETRLLEHAAVERAAVTVWDRDGDARLVAYVVVGEDDLDEGGLREHLRRSLPEYMVPQFFVSLPELPLTPNGKIDRRALPAPRPVDKAEGFEAARTASEEVICEIFSEVLDVPRVGRNQGFFELGGHSLLGARVMARLHRTYGVSIPLRLLFEVPTPAGLGEQLDRVLEGAVGADYKAIEPRGSDAPAPLSFTQERLWFLQQLAPDSTAYQLAGALELRGALDTAALDKALTAIVRRHDAFRTNIRLVDGQPMQVVTDGSAFHLERFDLGPAVTEVELADQLSDHASRPFDLGSDMLLRCALYRVGEDRHVLLVVCHHIVSDGWSAGIFDRELSLAYNRIARGQEMPFQPLPIHYPDFAAWQREWLEGEDVRADVEYWDLQLAGAPTHISLPTDRTRPPEFSHRGARHVFDIPASTRHALAEMSRDSDTTLFMTLLAVYSVTLARYSGQDDILVGSPVANRSRPEVEDLIGLFINSIVLRADVSKGRSFRELLASVRESCLAAYAHQQLPFEKVLELVNPPRDLSRNPVFQVMFAMQNMALPPVELEGIEVLPREIERISSQLDLTLFIWDTADGMCGSIEYATDLFDATTIERFARHFTNLLDAAAANPDRDVHRLPMLDALERQAILDAGSGMPVARDVGGDMLAMFATEARRRPDAVAVVFDDERLTYRELDEKSTRFARYLRARGVGAESLVGLCVPRGASLVTALLGILKAGGVFVPLDPDFPADRLRFMLEDSGARILVSVSTLPPSTFDGLPVQRVDLDSDCDDIDSCDSAPLEMIHQPDGLAYVLYTSGSTGRPKGVQIEHRALTNFLQAMQERPGLSDTDVLLAITTVSFDISLLEIFLPLTTGATVAIASRDVAHDGPQLIACLEKCGATVMQATPATWRMLLDYGWSPVPGLRILCGGEAFPPDIAARLLEAGAEVWNMYGPTETTIWSTCARVERADDLHIGTAIANTDVYVLNEQMEPQPTGVAGQLFIGGAGIARGYWNRPDLTSAAFVASPFKEGRTIYATGDLACWRNDGNLQHLGRVDSQIKLRGFRIELGEIEAVLLDHPDIRHCAAALRESRPGDQRLVAYFVPVAGVQTTVTSLRSHLKKRLPPYMIPQHFVDMDNLPLTPNGKVDRNALPQLGDNVAAAERFVAPATDMERRLADLWAAVLEVKQVGRHDNFFDIGGHSLLAARLAARMQQQLGIDVTLQSLTADTLSQIAAAFDDGDLGAAGRSGSAGGGGWLSSVRSAADAWLSRLRQR